MPTTKSARFDEVLQGLNPTVVLLGKITVDDNEYKLYDTPAKSVVIVEWVNGTPRRRARVVGFRTDNPELRVRGYGTTWDVHHQHKVLAAVLDVCAPVHHFGHRTRRGLTLCGQPQAEPLGKDGPQRRQRKPRICGDCDAELKSIRQSRAARAYDGR